MANSVGKYIMWFTMSNLIVWPTIYTIKKLNSVKPYVHSKCLCSGCVLIGLFKLWARYQMKALEKWMDIKSLISPPWSNNGGRIHQYSTWRACEIDWSLPLNGYKFKCNLVVYGFMSSSYTWSVCVMGDEWEFKEASSFEEVGGVSWR